MKRVPAHFVNCQLVALVGLLILAAVGLGTFVDVALLSTDHEGELVESIEVKTKTAGQGDEGSFFIGLFVF